MSYKEQLQNKVVNRKYRYRQTKSDLPKTIYNNLTFLQIKIGFHNINSIKRNYYKVQELIELGTSTNLDIIGITETNIQEKEGRYIKINRKNYSIYC